MKKQLILAGALCLGFMTCATLGHAQTLFNDVQATSFVQIAPENANYPTAGIYDNYFFTQNGVTGSVQADITGANIDSFGGTISANGGIVTDGSGATLSGGMVNGVNGVTDGTATLSSGSLTGAKGITASGTIQGSTLTDGAGTTINSGTVSANQVNANGFSDNAGTTIGSGKVTANTLSDGAGSTISGGVVSANSANISGTVNAGDVMVGGVADIHTVGNTLHFSENQNIGSIVMSDVGNTGDYNTISTSTGNLLLQNGNVSISQSGDVSIAGNTILNGNLTLGGKTVNGIAVGGAGFDNTKLATKGYVDQAVYNESQRAQRTETTLQRGIAMTAALETPTIEAGDNNAVKLSAAEYGGKAGLSIGYARRLWKSVSADVSAAADDSFEDGVVRGGVNYSF